MASAAVTKFLKDHPAFANMNHAQREAYRQSHPAFNNQWLAVNGFTGSWGNTAPAAKPGGNAPAPAPSAPAPAPVSTPPVVDPITALPYDYSSDVDEANAYSQYNSAISQYDQQDANANLDYTRQKTDIETNQAPALYRRLLNSYAGRGMAYSSGYATANEEGHNAVAQQLSDLLSNKDRTIAGNVSNRTNAQKTRDELLAAISRKRAAIAAGRYAV